MGLIVCDNNEVLHPFFISELNLNIYSYEELCFIIYENPVLVRENFISNELLEFIDLELGLTPLKSRLVKMNQDKVSDDDKLYTILGYGDVYSHNEVMSFKKLIDKLNKLHKAEYLMIKANYLFELRLYGRAVVDYSKILKFNKDKYVTTKFIASVWENLGSAYANLFMYNKAYDAYNRAYEVLKDKDILKKMYNINLIEPSIKLSSELLGEIDENDKNDWDEEFERVLNKASESTKVHNIENMFKKEDSDKLSKKMLIDWKLEYRSMM